MSNSRRFKRVIHFKKFFANIGKSPEMDSLICVKINFFKNLFINFQILFLLPRILFVSSLLAHLANSTNQIDVYHTQTNKIHLTPLVLTKDRSK